MPDFPLDFVADLRQLRRWPDLADSLWRSPVLVELTHGRLWRLVADALPSPPARVLDIGCGAGALSLAMAQAGHDVTAIDSDPSAMKLAERSAHRARPGRLTYHRSDVATWVADETSFDAIVTSRTLHHISDPAAALERIHGWLRPGGQLVCVDFFHDRFDRRDARWVAQVRGLLEATGTYRVDGRLPSDPAAAVERIEWEWERDHVIDHDLHRSADIVVPLSHCSRPVPSRGTPISTGTSWKASTPLTPPLRSPSPRWSPRGRRHSSPPASSHPCSFVSSPSGLPTSRRLASNSRVGCRIRRSADRP